MASPVSQDDGVNGGNKNAPLTASRASGVLTNDFDANHDPLSAIKLADRAHGTVTLDANGVHRAAAMPAERRGS